MAAEDRDDMVTSTIFISNLHCPSCIQGIRESLSGLDPAPEFISFSIVEHSIVLRHSTALALNDIFGSVEAAGFEIHSIFQDSRTALAPVEVCRPEERSTEWESSLEHAVARWFQNGSLARGTNPKEDMRAKHVEQCEQCKREAGGIQLVINSESDGFELKPQPAVTTRDSVGGDTLDGARSPISSKDDDFVKVDPASSLAVCKATIAIDGMTCSTCVNSITHAVEQLQYVRSIDINLLTNSAKVVFEGSQKIEEILETIEDTGFGATVDELEQSDKWRASYAIGGMTCSVCVGNTTGALKKLGWIEKVDVNMVSNSGSVIFYGKHHLPEIKEAIEDAGYEAALDSVVAEGCTAKETTERAVALRIEGMHCRHCPENVLQGLSEKYGQNDDFRMDGSSFSEKQPILHIRYTPKPPAFTIRDIFKTIEDVNNNFVLSVHHPPTIEERAREMHAQERRRVLFRLVLSVVVAIPTFILGIVFMSLVKESNPLRRYVMQPMWAGNATRLSWALFILATPVYFFAADTFHRRAFKELKALWRPGSRFSIMHRFTRFGSMNMLMSLGTSIAYFASIVELALAATKRSSGSMNDSYFDAVVFLTMFLLIGRFLEAYSKARTGDAVTSLGNLRPEEAILIIPEHGDVKISTDLLEVGDTVRVHHGTSPPFDGMVLEGYTDFDESSLTGESKPVRKGSGDIVYSGTVNKGPPIKITVTSIAGSSMLDQIINAVREGQTRRAPVERVANTITSHFVPFVVLVAIVTWVIWLVLGTTGAIPEDWMNEGSGGWALWSLRFAIAVFVIACPCGIGLAAPTALFVGGGLAAKHGILVRGGGEAFQEASSLDCIVFDKTGTLTQGGDPAVTDHKLVNNHDHTIVLAAVKALEENSNHPIARALVAFCKKETQATSETVTVDEVPGKGLKGSFKIGDREVAAIIGNEAFMADHHVVIPADEASMLQTWKRRGESIALAAILSPAQPDKDSEQASTDKWELASIFAIADPLRPEAANVIAQLKKRGIDIWMLSGDNAITANAVAAQIGIPPTNVIAGVLPDQKAEKIKYLQKTLTKKPTSTLFGIPFFRNSRKSNKRATIAMVGDGINDAPALSTADLSIAIGSGSDIALSSSSFILITSRLTSLLTLLDLSRVVFRRVYFNFGWALIYNIIAMPIAAGVLYPITTGEKKMDMHHNGVGMEGGMGMGESGVKHVRLDPVWASLAMALSSVSVVCSSLLLRSGVPGVGFQVRSEE
ncbi:heavy metal translocatin [Byssothecium circinans]|uniref:Heavy metal translocatin n=1 Tax=Byssothecium circinans TaxID=147558 RepID=A0A6A5TG56_9PLEO|nr:heavy metal translocatin [Byssothecium circinans]